MQRGEQIAPKSFSECKPNHLSRYEWAAHFIKPGMHVLDAAAGVGYGSYILATTGAWVRSIDRSNEAMHWWEEHWDHPRILSFTCGDVCTAELVDYDAIVSIETIEHVPDADAWVGRFKAPLLIATVPNQDVVPFSKETHKFHHRHYTKDEFAELLNRHGYEVRGWWTQYGKWERHRMVPGTDGMTLGVIATR